ncbi:unnamed protein product [Brassica rapa]|uniref:Uncharacterized protein n=2 Tax=Brassica TaxID=3705 RepID=A0A8D9HYA0_BRACM|nr:unnamed protein product [Brassica napus]CAG7907239.1 unnamed protein product [Brassica rapa]
MLQISTLWVNHNIESNRRALRELIFAAPDALPCLRVSSSSRKLSTKRVPMASFSLML